jgi:hypothetical protein
MFGFGNTPDYENPADDAMPYLESVPGTVQPIYQPYIDQGLKSGGILANEYGQMATNPGDYYNNIMSGYTQSDAYKYNQQQAMAQQQAAANAGGYTGTSFDQANQAYTTNGLLANDEQQYYNNVTGAQRYGLQGESHLFDTGYEASNQLANDLVQNLYAEAGLSYKGTAADNQKRAQHNSNMWTAGGLAAGLAL